MTIDFLSVMLAFEDMVNDAAERGHFWSDKSTRPRLTGYLGFDHHYGRADVLDKNRPSSSNTL